MTKCKVGDLAIVIRGSLPDSPHIGKIVEVVSRHSQNKKFGHIWNVRVSVPVITRTVTRSGKDLGQVGFRSELQSPDDWLCPLPKINEGIQDETLLRLPAPSTEKEAA